MDLVVLLAPCAWEHMNVTCDTGSEKQVAWNSYLGCNSEAAFDAPTIVVVFRRRCHNNGVFFVGEGPPVNSI